MILFEPLAKIHRKTIQIEFLPFITSLPPGIFFVALASLIPNQHSKTLDNYPIVVKKFSNGIKISILKLFSKKVFRFIFFSS